MYRRKIPGFDHYWATSDGEILSRHPRWRDKSFKKLRCRIKRQGYVYICLYGKDYSVHRLICRTFHGEPPSPTDECRHLNGDKTDNRAINLCWGTKQDNLRDRAHLGTIKLVPEMVAQIRYYLMFGADREDLANNFNVGYQNICLIARGERWREENCGYTEEFQDWIEMQKLLPHHEPRPKKVKTR